MGMYDSIIVDIDMLPVSDDEKELMNEGNGNYTWQTKDLDCNLDTYTIDDKGRLLLAEYNWKKKTKHETEYFDYTGVINFYNSVMDEKRKITYWYEFNAGFANGNLVRIIKTKKKELTKCTEINY